MNIVVVGGGKFGKATVEMLKNENHNIIVIDNDKEVVKSLTDEYNVVGYYGNGASLSVLEEAGAKGADLLVSCTGSDEINILCCAVSKIIGVKASLARITNNEYQSQIDDMSSEFRINAFINATKNTALEIFRTICFPGAIRVESFAKGRVDIAEIKVEEDNNLLCGHALKDIKNKYDLESLVCAVKRGDDVVIPYGDFILQADDDMYIASNPKELVKTCKLLKLYGNKQNNVIIIGASEIAANLVLLLTDAGINSVVIERDKEIAEAFASENEGCIVINDDGTNMELLESEGLKNSVLVTLTGVDETNIVVSSLALKEGCPKVITKVSNSNLDPFLDVVGLDSIVSPKDVFAQTVARYVRMFSNDKPSEVRYLYKLFNDRVEALEFKVNDETKYTNIPIKELNLKHGYLIASIIRHHKVIMPKGDDMIKVDDRVVIVTTSEGTKDLGEIFR